MDIRPQPSTVGSATESTVQQPLVLRVQTSEVTPVTTTNNQPTSSHGIQWSEDVIDNEFLGRKKSKCCCVYHKPRRWDESSSSSSSSPSSSDDEDHDHTNKAPSSTFHTHHCRGHTDTCYRHHKRVNKPDQPSQPPLESNQPVAANELPPSDSNSFPPRSLSDEPSI